MDLNTLWFILIGFLFTGYFFLEGFDFGVGMLLPLISKKDNERRMIINSIGTFWDGNEVWLVVAGGAMFAAFPHWYATLFSGFYLPLFVILLALIIRGVSFEFRSSNYHPAWRHVWDWMLFTGSLVPALLWGVAFANFLRGVPIDANMNYTGGFLNLVNMYALLTGLLTFGLFMLHGALFLNLRTSGEIRAKARNVAQFTWSPVLIVFIAFAIYSSFATDLYTHAPAAMATSFFAVVALVFVRIYLRQRKSGLAFTMTGLVILFTVATMFVGLYPRLLISSLYSDWSLTIHNASSSPYTLKVMSIVILIFMPVVMAYQAWTYWIFRKRLVSDRDLEY